MPTWSCLPVVRPGVASQSAVTLGEIQAGIELTREQNPTKAAEIEAWLELLAGAYNVLPMDAATFRVWARLMHRKSDAIYEGRCQDRRHGSADQKHLPCRLTNGVKIYRVIHVTYCQ